MKVRIYAKIDGSDEEVALHAEPLEVPKSWESVEGALYIKLSGSLRATLMGNGLDFWDYPIPALMLDKFFMLSDLSEFEEDR